MRGMDELSRMRRLSDGDVLQGLTGALRASRGATAAVLAFLGEVEERRLHLLAGQESMFAYCLFRVGMSEDEACRRIDVARLARRFPSLLEKLESGAISLSVAALLKPYLADDNQVELLGAVSGKTIQQAREALAALFPKNDVVASIRRLPPPPVRVGALGGSATASAEWAVVAKHAPPSAIEARGGGEGEALGSVAPDRVAPVVPQAPSAGATISAKRPGAERAIEPLSLERYKVQFTADRELKQKLDLVRDLLRHTIPSGDLAAIVARAIDLLIEQTTKRRFGGTTRQKKTAPATTRTLPTTLAARRTSRATSRPCSAGPATTPSPAAAART